MASYTSNYQLHQWVPEDDFLRTDFNEDFQKIDAGIAAVKGQADSLEADKVGVVTGRYNGNGAASRAIDLGFQPKAVLVEEVNGRRTSNGSQFCFGGLSTLNGSGSVVSLTATGFQVYFTAGVLCTNFSGESYVYAALR